MDTLDIIKKKLGVLPILHNIYLNVLSKTCEGKIRYERINIYKWRI